LLSFNYDSKTHYHSVTFKTLKYYFGSDCNQLTVIHYAINIVLATIKDKI